MELIDKLTILTDSQLVVKQAQGDFCIKDQKMIAYVEAIMVAMKGWPSIKMKLINKSNNEEAYTLAVKKGTSPYLDKGRWIQVETIT